MTLTENDVRTCSNSASNLEVVSLGLDGKSADFSETVSMMDEVMTLTKAEQDDDDCKKTVSMMDEVMTLTKAEQNDDDGKKACDIKSFGQTEDKDQLSNADERNRERIVEETIDVPITHRRVFIVDDCDELIPEWLNFVKGVLDSEDIPLNVYRETLLQNKILRVIRKSHVTKYLEMLAEIAEEKDDDYKKFCEQFGKRLKLGIHESFIDGVETAELLRFNTSKPRDEQISFKECVHRVGGRAERHLLHHRGEYLCRILFVVRGKFAQEGP